MKTNIKDLNFIVASFLKYCYQERKDVYMEDINMFIDFLTNNNIVALETDDLNSFFDNNQDIFSIDFDDKIGFHQDLFIYFNNKSQWGAATWKI